VTWRILDPDEEFLATVSASGKVGIWSESNFQRQVIISSPIVWSPESPKFCRLITTVESGSQIVDRTEAGFGIRTVAFDATNG
jgi:beta-galactosidase